MNFLLLLFAVFLVAKPVVALSAAEWRSQSIYQLLTDRFARTEPVTNSTCGDLTNYCGGTWKGIIRNLDYIQGMGFTAIWISPVVEQIEGHSQDGSSYHGYWAQNIEKVNHKFGTEMDLIALSTELHRRGMYLMVDVVTNHMAYLGAGVDVDYSGFVPFNNKRYFHDYCPDNFTTPEITQTCWMGSNIVSLPDLRTEDKDFVDIWAYWIKRTVLKYKIDGIRLDSAQQVDPPSLKSFESAAGVYVMGEVFNGDPKIICPYQTELSGVLNYANYFWIFQAFTSTVGSIANLASGIDTMKTLCRDTTTLGSFIENHDRPRFASQTLDLSLAKNAIGFMMFADGIPIVYYGLEQRLSGNGISSDGNGVPGNRQALWDSGYDTSSPLYAFIRDLNMLRKHIFSPSGTYLNILRRDNIHSHTHQNRHIHVRSSSLDPRVSKASVIYKDDHTILMQRLDSIGVYSNLGASNRTYSLLLSRNQTGLAARTHLVEILSCVIYTTDEAGTLTIPMELGLPRVLYPEHKLKGSGLCKNGLHTSSTVATSTSSPTIIKTGTATLSILPLLPAPICSSIPITFSVQLPPDVLRYAIHGDTVLKIIGEQASLGTWKPEKAVPLSKHDSVVWNITLDFVPGIKVVYNFIRVDATGGVVWEGGSKRVVEIPSLTACTEEGIVRNHVWGI